MWEQRERFHRSIGSQACSVEASHFPSFDRLTKCSFNQHIWWGLCYVPDTLLGARGTSENKEDKKPRLQGAYIAVWRTDSKQTLKTGKQKWVSEYWAITLWQNQSRPRAIRGIERVCEHLPTGAAWVGLIEQVTSE